MKTLKIFALFTFVLFITACSDDPQITGCDTDFDQEGMFTNLADNLIIPAYTDLKVKVDVLEAKVSDFQSNTNQSTLDNLRTAWFDAYLAWQVASPYEFGPGAVEFLHNSLNNFPLDTAIVNEKIQNSDYDFTSPDAYDKGFPAMDYLLYGIAANDAEIINKYTTASTPTLYSFYLDGVINDIKSRVDNTFNAWTEGTYKTEFVTNTGTAAGSSLSLIVNGFNQNYEYIKRDKLGIPSGVLTLGFINPTKVEAYFSGRSLELAVKGLESSRDFYLGKTGLSLDDYLEAIGTMKGDKTLNAAIQEQFTTAINSVSNLQNQLSDIVENDAQSVVNVYNEVTKQLINIKTDMPSVLCVSITYIDNPSDSD
ncbi:MAG: putative lipoprotein [Cognaticolwellia sp.]|jgi:predicted lipoprotein